MTTASTINLFADRQDHHLARMSAAALGLSLLEMTIPSPLPGIKPGLANIVTMIVWVRYGWKMAAWVTFLRILAAAMLFGTLFSPAFFLSVAGGICSLLALLIATKLPERFFGFVTHSILAAFAHIAGQLGLVYLWLIPQLGLLNLMPLFACAALVFGIVNGWIVARYFNVPAPSRALL